MQKRTIVVAGLSLLAVVGCKDNEPPVVYQAIPVVQRDIVVSAQASGTIQPDTIVEVKSKAPAYRWVNGTAAGPPPTA